MASDVTLYTTLPAETQWMDGQWVATQKDLALHAFGKTAQEASSRLMEVINAVIDTLIIVGGRDAVAAHMKRAGLPFELSDDFTRRDQPLKVVLPVVRSLEST